jgi:hypothetical protein
MSAPRTYFNFFRQAESSASHPTPHKTSSRLTYMPVNINFLYAVGLGMDRMSNQPNIVKVPVDEEKLISFGLGIPTTFRR